MALLGVIERVRHCLGDDLALHALHHVERSADHRLPVAHREHPRRSHRRGFERGKQPCFAKHVMGARRQRAARRAAQHDAGRKRERDVRVSIPDRGGIEVVGRLEAAAAQELEQRFQHQQRLALVACAVGVSADDVVGCQSDCHFSAAAYPSPARR